MRTIEFTDRLVVMTCWCGINHAVPADLQDYQRRQFDAGRTPIGIHCPLGHTHVPAGVPEHERVRKQLDRERERAARLAAERDQAKASARAQKGAATRARRRHAAALCPVCNRSFAALAAHLATKHPDYDPAKGDA